jgi:acyl-coenzyme A thioesterase PaaI-like protein
MSKRETILQHAKTLPFLVRCGCEIHSCEPGLATAGLTVSEELAGGTGHLNGTELYGLLDCAAWFAVALMLEDDEAAVTHDAHFSLLSVAPVGAEVRFSARVEKRGRALAFIRVEAQVGEKLVATARITKSIIAHSVRMRHATAEAR